MNTVCFCSFDTGLGPRRNTGFNKWTSSLSLSQPLVFPRLLAELPTFQVVPSRHRASELKVTTTNSRHWFRIALFSLFGEIQGSISSKCKSPPEIGTYASVPISSFVSTSWYRSPCLLVLVSIQICNSINDIHIRTPVYDQSLSQSFCSSSLSTFPPLHQHRASHLYLRFHLYVCVSVKVYLYVFPFSLLNPISCCPSCHSSSSSPSLTLRRREREEEMEREVMGWAVSTCWKSQKSDRNSLLVPRVALAFPRPSARLDSKKRDRFLFRKGCCLCMLQRVCYQGVTRCIYRCMKQTQHVHETLMTMEKYDSMFMFPYKTINLTIQWFRGVYLHLCHFLCVHLHFHLHIFLHLCVHLFRYRCHSHCLHLSVGLYVDLTLLHSCTFLSLVTELLCALDHSSNAFALAQGAPQNRVPFDIVADKRHRKWSRL